MGGARWSGADLQMLEVVFLDVLGQIIHLETQARSKHVNNLEAGTLTAGPFCYQFISIIRYSYEQNVLTLFFFTVFTKGKH